MIDCGRILVKGIPDKSHDQTLTMVEQSHKVMDIILEYYCIHQKHPVDTLG